VNAGPYWREFAADCLPGTCRWCGRPLRVYFRDRDKPAKEQRRGDYGDEMFCGLRCGYLYGLGAIKVGAILEKNPDAT
jgi:hypothetical protein